MKKILIITALTIFLLGMATQAQAAFLDGFENWTNPELAVNWNKSVHGYIWGGEFNQVYNAGQGVSCGGNSVNYKSVYRDVAITAGEGYYATVEAMSNSTNTLGIRDGSYVRLWMQFNDSSGRLIAPHGTTGTNLSDKYFSEMRVDGTAPAGSSTARIILQVMGGTGGGTVFTNFNMYKIASSGSIKVAGPDFIRNTEWLNKSHIQQLWTAYSEGGGPGDYEMRATSGSSQGISCGGNSGGYRDFYRTFDIASYKSPNATTNEATVSVTSNALNQNGVKDADQVEMYIQFLDSSNRLVGTASAKGSQFGVNSQDAVKMKVSGATPNGATKILVIMRVLAGTGGGAVFDNFELVTM